MNWIRQTFEIPHSNHKPIISMEGVRGYAVFLVFLVHYVTLFEPWVLPESFTLEIATYMRNVGNSGVDLFFVLSGYLIYGTLIKQHTPFFVYMIRRIKRIYPVFLFIFVIYLLLSLVFPSESKLPTGWDNTLIYLAQNLLFLPGLMDIEPVITVAWSLSYELFYYLSIPVLISVFAMRSWPRSIRVGFFCVFSLTLFAYFYQNEGPIRLLMFVSGILLYETISSDRVKRFPPIGLWALVISMLVMVVFQIRGYGDWFRFLALYFLFFLFCLECFVSVGITNRWFSFPPIRWLGNMSYSYYLIHGLALKAVFLILAIIYPATADDVWIFWILLPPIFLFTLVPSALVFIVVEKPYSLMSKYKRFDKT